MGGVLRNRLKICIIAATAAFAIPTGVESLLKATNMEKSAEKKAIDLHRVDSINLMLYTLLLLVTVLTVWLFKHRRFRYVHETGLTLIYGLIVGLILKFTSVSRIQSKSLLVVPENSSAEQNDLPDYLLIRLDMKERNNTFRYRFDSAAQQQSEALIEQKATFDPEVFFNVILPPIIFNAGYSLKKRHFFRNIGSILMFAILGTTVSCLITGFIMFGIMSLSSALNFTLNDSLYFGAIISSTDPVTILAIFNDLHVDVDLFALVFGESALNDAVAIVLSSTIEQFVPSSDNKKLTFDMQIVLSVGQFLFVFFGSLGVGILNGCGAALLTKFTRIADFPILETSLFILSSYLSFLMAEASGMTGVVAVLFCGICQAHYTYNNISDESQKRTKQFFEILNFLAENFIFTYIGVSMFTSSAHSFSPLFICGAFPVAFIARAAFIYPFSLLLNLCRKPTIPLNHQHMLLFAGLRGAVAFALAIRNTSTMERRVIYTTTSLIVIFTVLVNGGLATQMTQWLKIRHGAENEAEMQPQFQPVGPFRNEDPASRSPNTRRYNPWDKSFLPRKWYNFDSRYLKPLLTNSRPTLLETTSECCLPFARLMTTTRQMNDGLTTNNGNDLVSELENNFDSTASSTASAMEENFAYQSFSPTTLNMALADGPAVTVSSQVERRANGNGDDTNLNNSSALKFQGVHGAPV